MFPIGRSVLTSNVVTIGTWHDTLLTGYADGPITKSKWKGSTLIATDLYVTFEYIEKYASYNGFNGFVISCGVKPVPYQRLGPSAPKEYIDEGPIISFLASGRT